MKPGIKFFVTGGAGFIGSNFCDYLLAQDNSHEVVIYDDLSTGREEFIESALKTGRCRLIKGDIREFEQVSQALIQERPDWTIHFAANADVRFGTERPRRDLDYNTIGTWNVVEGARLAGCRNIIFSSTGSVYGEPEIFPTPETAPFPVQTSLYAASKLAGEGILGAYAHGFGMTAIVMRFVSILGPRYTHGHVVDFTKQLHDHPAHMRILGDGNQDKSYLHVNDLARGLWMVMKKHQGQSGFEVYNIGRDDSLIVRDSIDYITARLGLNPEREYTGGVRGWVGDSPKILLDAKKIKELGWRAEYTLRQAVEDTVDDLVKHPSRWNA